MQGHFLTIERTHNIGPHSFEWYVCLSIAPHNFSHIFNISVPESALMKTQTPVGHHCRFPRHFAELSRNFNRVWASEKVQVNDPAHCIVFEILTILLRFVDFDIHSITVDEGDCMGGIALMSMFKIYWMIAVQIRPWWNHTGISRPKRSTVVSRGKHHRICMLTKPVENWARWQRGSESQVLGFEDKVRAACIENSLMANLSYYSERERIFNYSHFQRRIFC